MAGAERGEPSRRCLQQPLEGQVTKGRPGESLEDSEQGSDRKKLTFLRDLHGKETGGELARRASEGVA